MWIYAPTPDDLERQRVARATLEVLSQQGNEAITQAAQIMTEWLHINLAPAVQEMHRIFRENEPLVQLILQHHRQMRPPRLKTTYRPRKQKSAFKRPFKPSLVKS